MSATARAEQQGFQPTIEGKFLDIVAELPVYLEEVHGMQQMPTREALKKQTDDAVFYEIDETEGPIAKKVNKAEDSDDQKQGIFGIITIHLLLYNANLQQESRHVIEIHSTNHYEQAGQDNTYRYQISLEALNQALFPLIGVPDDIYAKQHDLR